jgi:D-3-phosphoglycerate dehydrogenase
MKKVVILTQKPFSSMAVDGIKEILEAKGYSVVTVEKYKTIDETYETIKDANALIVRSDIIDETVMDHAPELEIIVRAGAGYDSIDLAAASKRNIVVENTPGQNANAVAELVFAMMLYNARHHFNGSTGSELRGKKLGIQGLGAVGKNVARIADGFGMDVYYFDYTFPTEVASERGVQFAGTLENLYKTCQYITIHIPLSESNQHSINYDLISLMPKNAVLINTSRSEVVDDDDIMRILAERPDFSYLADVPCAYMEEMGEKYSDRSLFSLKKCGAQTAEANNNAGMAAANQIVNFFESGIKKYQVNP